MRQYQVVLAKLQGKAREDEETLTDLLNERARSGWRFDSATSVSPRRLLVVFTREA